MIAVENGPARQFLTDWGKKSGKPIAIVMLSAHFEAPIVTVTASARPKTIHDFGGFPDFLYRLSYPASGDADLARRIAKLLSAGGLHVREDSNRGLDHGAWIPLLLMYPDADVPVVQLSIDSRKGPAYHFRLGELLRPLRDEGVLIMGSGSVTHNLRHAFRSRHDDPAPEEVMLFREWIADRVASDRRDELANYRSLAPHATFNHPTEEHLLPLLSAMGAIAPDEPRRRIHASETYGSLAMDAYLFGKHERGTSEASGVGPADTRS